MGICEHYPAPALAACTTHLSTHDTERALTALADEPLDGRDRNWQSERRLSETRYEYGVLRLQLAFVLQFTLPGIPCVYYGDEIAMQGYKDPFNRAYFDWHSGESRLIKLMMELSTLRRSCAAFKTGALRFLRAENGLLVYERRGGGAAAAVAVNCSGQQAEVELLGERCLVPTMDCAYRVGN